MFNRKKCNFCNSKIGKEFSYCPFCGHYVGDKEKETKDYGMLGKTDMTKNISEAMGMNGVKLPMGMNMIFNKLMKEMGKQLKELDKEIDKDNINAIPIKKGSSIRINISSNQGSPIIEVSGLSPIKAQTIKKSIKKTIDLPKMNEEKIKKLTKLPRQEAASKVRRLSGRVVYEIELPEVESKEDININQLENSIEIKAFSKDKAYFKFLPVSLPLLAHDFSEGKLTLELGENLE
jgi:HSP20 family molecular chaperone IbpA